MSVGGHRGPRKPWFKKRGGVVVKMQIPEENQYVVIYQFRTSREVKRSFEFVCQFGEEWRLHTYGYNRLKEANLNPVDWRLENILLASEAKTEKEIPKGVVRINPYS